MRMWFELRKENWALALEPQLLARMGAPFAPRVVSRLFQRAMRNLETCLQAAQ